MTALPAARTYFDGDLRHFEGKLSPGPGLGNVPQVLVALAVQNYNGAINQKRNRHVLERAENLP